MPPPNGLPPPKGIAPPPKGIPPPDGIPAPGAPLGALPGACGPPATNMVPPLFFSFKLNKASSAVTTPSPLRSYSLNSLIDRLAARHS
jgi:hypothetical protein